MGKLLVTANEATAAQRRVYFHLVDATDGLTAETGENGGQPQISTNGAAWTNTGIGTLTAIGNGRYYADLTQAAVATAGDLIETRYKSANTAECPGDSVQVVAFDPNDAVRLGLTALPNVASGSDGSLMVRGATQDVTLKSLTIENSAGPGITVTTTNAADSGVRIFGTGAGITASASETDGIAIYGKATGAAGGIGILGAGGTGASAAGVKGTVGSGGGAPWAGLWEMLTSSTAFATAGSIGKRIVDNLDAAISSITITAASIWTYASRTLTQTSTQAATAAASGNAISIRRGDSLSLTITGLGTLTGYSKIWFTVKRRASDADSEAVLQIEQSVGLVYINGAAGTAANGAITVNDATTGSITITLQEAAADDLPALTGGVWDVQSLISSTVTTHATGSISIAADVTRAVS